MTDPATRARRAVLAWYEPRTAAYPWRGRTDPYAILVSEVMLQQTQASRVAAAFVPFLRRFPSIGALAAAPRAEVVRAWAGLGYHRRAVSLSEAARAIVRDHGGRVPREVAELRRLPGIGPYTAAAMVSFAYGVPVAAIDTNVRRVVARVHLGREAHEVGADEVATLADAWLDRREPGTWNAAVMDLGREVCRPRPKCEVCPVARACRFLAAGTPVSQAPRRQGPFEGSARQTRGAIVRALRSRPSRTLQALAAETGLSLPRLAAAVSGLVDDGIVSAGPAAREGRPQGRIRLAP